MILREALIVVLHLAETHDLTEEQQLACRTVSQVIEHGPEAVMSLPTGPLRERCRICGLTAHCMCGALKPLPTQEKVK